MDVKGRAQTRAADLMDKAGAMTVQLRSSAAQAGHTVHGRVTSAGHRVQDGATTAGHQLHDGARHPRPALVVGAAVAVVVAVVVAWRYPRR